MAARYPNQQPSFTGPHNRYTTERNQGYAEEVVAIAAELGIAPRVSTVFGASSSVRGRLDGNDDRIVAAADFGTRDLVVYPDGALPLRKVVADITALPVRGRVLTNASITADITTTGLGGLDTGAEAGNQWYGFYAGHNGATVGGVLSTATTAAGLNLSHSSFAGYSWWRRVAWVRNDGSSNFIPFLKQGNRVRWMAEVDVTQVLTTGTPATTFTAISNTELQKFIPPLVQQASLDCALRAIANTSVSAASRAELRFRPVGSTLTNGHVRACGVWVVTGTFQSVIAHDEPIVVLTGTRQLEYKLVVATSGVNTDYVVDIAVAGYFDPGS